MSNCSKPCSNLPPEQQAIRAKCFHRSGAFVEFPIEEVETSIPVRFKKVVGLHGERLAIKDQDRSVTYAELNALANRIGRAILENSQGVTEPVAPAYLRGEGTGEPPTKLSVIQGPELLRARAQAVLTTDHTGQAARHVERSRTQYRRVARLYRPPCYAGRITILGSEKLYRQDPTLGWSEPARNNLRTYPVPGDHETYLREYVHVTAQQLRKCLEQAENQAGDKSPCSEKVRAHE